jgi:GH24 family phage-related lysozyme (muramidase)/energy-coupling factor transporter ATP-binding protein EcfA2
MDASTSRSYLGAAPRTPSEPYPGLRPFLDYEAALLFGRERQVREVIERLAKTQFVAVLGGSGSGKSSLIHAGVVPALRSYGIPGAGDLWLPMTCTPGTNVSAADSQARAYSPITRLARRFAGLLKSRGSEQADTQRLQDIAEIFRQQAGFARLLEVFAKELNVPVGPNPADARVLFVVDQFEELFHPTNKTVADASVLVERVLDHFFNPHPNCHVILTMRSEHLNDCAAYLELPDAINKSSYLIRRLDADELRQAIVAPAQRFLRLLARSQAAGNATAAATASANPNLPAEVVFEPAVVQRLLRDVQAITQDPDHLPLLQHLLARVWEAALKRTQLSQGAGSLVPATITEADLAQAVLAKSAQPGQSSGLPDALNTLRASVENWPESIYWQQSTTGREELDGLLRCLAFKDPNTGLYSQQRVGMTQALSLLGPHATPTDLRALLGEGFLGSVDYLFWDAEEPTRVTLKVSHESFIRGWARFRGLIDAESVRFAEYTALLRKCAEWVDNGKSADFLLQAPDKRRMGDSGLEARLRSGEQRAAWGRFLGLHRDGARLAAVAPELDSFVSHSSAHIAQLQQREVQLLEREEQARLRARKVKVLSAVTAVCVVLGTLVPTALFSIFVQAPTMRRAELLFEAGNRANGVLLNFNTSSVGGAATNLTSLLLAAERVEQAREGTGSMQMSVSKQALQWGARWPLFRDQRDFLDAVFLQAEPPVNSTLRQLLSTAVWRAAPGFNPQAEGARWVAAPAVFKDMPCAAGQGTDGPESPRGTLYVQGGSGVSDLRAQRAVFVPDSPALSQKLEIFSATYWPNKTPGNGACRMGEIVVNLPDEVNGRAAFDASLRLFYLTYEGSLNKSPWVEVQEVDWERAGDGLVRSLGATRVGTLSEAGALRAVKAAVGAERASVLPTWRVDGGRVVQVGDKFWRLVSRRAQRVDLVADANGAVPGLVPLAESPSKGACEQVAEKPAAAPGFTSEFYEHQETCFRIDKGYYADGQVGRVGEAGQPERNEVNITVFSKPGAATMLPAASDNPPAPTAKMAPFARLLPADVERAEGRWWAGTSGPYAGWLFVRNTDSKGELRYVGTPWSTCALWRLGTDVQEDNRRPAPAAAGAAATPDPLAAKAPSPPHSLNC